MILARLKQNNMVKGFKKAQGLEEEANIKVIKAINKNNRIYNSYIREKTERELIYNTENGISDKFSDEYSKAWDSMSEEIDFADICEYIGNH